MSRREDARSRRGPGLLGSLAVAGGLLAAGFALGLVVGASFEDPELLVTALAGRSQAAPLPGAADEDAADAGRARSDAPPPLGTPGTRGASPQRASAPAPSAARAAPSPPAPPPVAAPPPAGGFAVQVGAFADRGPADALEHRLEGSGFAAYVARADDGGVHRWRVRVGPVARREEAEGLARRLKQEQGLPTWVVSDVP